MSKWSFQSSSFSFRLILSPHPMWPTTLSCLISPSSIAIHERWWMIAVERTAGRVELGIYARVTQLGLVITGGTRGRCHMRPSTMPSATYNCTWWDECMATMGRRAAGGCRWWRRPLSCNASRICFSVSRTVNMVCHIGWGAVLELTRHEMKVGSRIGWGATMSPKVKFED